MKKFLKQLERCEQDGANIIDIGAMSTAPYLETNISVEEELKRMRYAIEGVKKGCKLPISIDTPRSKVAKEGIKHGADAINDVTGLKYDKNMRYIVSKAKIPVIIGAFGDKQSSSKSGKIPSTQ